MREKRKTDALWIFAIVFVVCAVVLGGGGYFAYTMYNKFFADSTMEETFGDQHLKTAVALIELHKVRYGRYPDRIEDIRFTGEWDMIHLNSVKYTVNESRTRYYVGINRGWIGTPDIAYPQEFWQGTGFDPGLRPAD